MRFSRNFARLFLLLFCAAGAAHAGERDKVVATVNEVKITAAEVNQQVQRLLPAEVTFHSAMNEERKKGLEDKALNVLVDTELQYQDALAKGLKPDKKETAKELERIVAGYKSKKEYKKVLENAGFTEESLKRFLERAKVAEKIKKREVDDKVRVTDEAVKEYYEKNRSMYLKPEEYKASHILIKVAPAATAEEKDKLKARAEALLKRVMGGEDFADVAAAESEDSSRILGGNIGSFHAGQTVPEFEEAVKKLKVGEVSGVVQTMYGFHIIKLTAKKESRQIPFEEIREKVKSQMIEREKKRLTEEWMNGLKSRAKIEYPKEG